jgi:membrane fusion protein, type I secretion system
MMSLDAGAHRSIRRHLVAGVAAAALLAGGVGGWAATTELAGAVIAPGLLVVESNVKKVQHLTGGIVGELRVREGDRVRAGDVVVRLGDTQTRASLAIVTKGLDEMRARQARLEAERDGAVEPNFRDDLLSREGDKEVARVLAGERKLFELRQSARAGQKAQLKERIAQLKEEIQGLTGQTAAKKREIELIAKELEGVRELWKKNLVAIQRVTELERTAARLEGERGELIARQAQAKGKISETELQILQVEQDLRSEVAKELRDIQAKTAEFEERKVAAEDLLKRIDLRAPQDGQVHQLGVHTLGGVIGEGETVMLIVPEADALKIEARIAPQDIDQIRLEQKALLRFSAFNQRTTPELAGEVSRISADLTQDQKTGVAYYTVRVDVPDAELAKLGGLKLVPGMPVEAFIQTGERTVLSYLLKPLGDHVAKAFREE